MVGYQMSRRRIGRSFTKLAAARVVWKGAER
jgi:hypothetical protein